MDTLFTAVGNATLSDPWWQQALPGAMQAFVAFTLVAARLAGMLLIAPAFGHPGLSIVARALLVATMAALLTPTLLTVDSSIFFERLDRDRDERLHVDEVAPSLQPTLHRLLRAAGKPEGEGLAPSEFRLTPPLPQSLVEYGCLALVELALGGALGLGMTALLSAFLMAGSLIEQQLGFSAGEMLNPESGASVGVSAQLLHQLGLVAFLMVGGHLLLVSALLETFQALPIGYAWLGSSLFDVLVELVGQSFELALRISAPLLVMTTLVGLALGFAGRAVPQLNLLVVGFPVRALVGLFLIGVALGGVDNLVSLLVPEGVRSLRDAAMGT